MKRSGLAILLCALPLMGCGMTCYTCEAFDPSLKASREVAEAAGDDATCRSYGTAPGSPNYVQCRMNLENNRAQLRATAVGAMLRR